MRADIDVDGRLDGERDFDIRDCGVKPEDSDDDGAASAVSTLEVVRTVTWSVPAEAKCC